MAGSSDGITCCGKLRDERYCGGCGRLLWSSRKAASGEVIISAGDGHREYVLINVDHDNNTFSYYVGEEYEIEVRHDLAAGGDLILTVAGRAEDDGPRKTYLRYVVYPPDKIGPYEPEKDES